MTRDEPGKGDDVACEKCGATALDTGLECSECGHDNWQAVTGKPFGAVDRCVERGQLQRTNMIAEEAKQEGGGMEWIDVTKGLPESGKPVLVAYTKNGRQKWARACWIPKHFEEDTGNYCGDADYNESNDTYYWPPGWYEWNEFEDTHWRIDSEITHWARIELPANAEITGG